MSEPIKTPLQRAEDREFLKELSIRFTEAYIKANPVIENNNLTREYAKAGYFTAKELIKLLDNQ